MPARNNIGNGSKTRVKRFGVFGDMCEKFSQVHLIVSAVDEMMTKQKQSIGD